MYLKIIGAIFVLIACGGMGAQIALNYKRQIRCLRSLASALELMQSELKCRLTPLPDLCRLAAGNSEGVISKTFEALVQSLEGQISPDAECCMNAVLNQAVRLPPAAMQVFRSLGKTMGRFDLEGQVSGISSALRECNELICKFSENQDNRMRSYQTLGLCAGAAMVILFI